MSPKFKELELTDRRADKMNSGFTVNREERLNMNKRDSRAVQESEELLFESTELPASTNELEELGIEAKIKPEPVESDRKEVETQDSSEKQIQVSSLAPLALEEEQDINKQEITSKDRLQILNQNQMPGHTGQYIYTDDLSEFAVTESKLAPFSVDASKLKPDAVGSEALQDYAVTSIHIADGAIVSAKLAEASVSDEHLIDGSVSGHKLRNASIAGEKIRDGSITSQKLGNQVIDSSKIADGSIGTRHLSRMLVTEDLIQNHAVTGDKIAISGVDTRHLTGGLCTRPNWPTMR